MSEETHIIVLTKPARGRSLRDKVIKSNLTTLLASVNTRSLGMRGWTISPEMPDDMPYMRRVTETHSDGSCDYEYAMPLTVAFSKQGETPKRSDLYGVVNTVNTRASKPPYGSWTVTTVDGETWTPPANDDDIATSNDLVGYTEVNMPSDWEGNFDHLFGLDAHIGIIKSALEAGVASDWTNRFHCALIGPPGCGKTDISRTVKSILGEEAVMEFDATSTTGAGAIKELTDLDILPRVLIVEEIEKADEKAMQFLLGVMDLRGEIRKTTARNVIQRNTKLFVIATVNNTDLFEKAMSGALASRFSNPVYFRRPTRDLLALILTREVDKIEGDTRWINPALDYCEQRGITDPRQAIALCLCGRDKWLTGEYERMLDATRNPDELASPV